MSSIERISDADVPGILEAVVQPDYWRSMNPGLSIGSGSAAERLSMEGEELAALHANALYEGYCQVDQLLPPHQARQLARAVSRLEERGCPTVFAFVYDEFWTACRKLAPLLGRILDEPYQQLPDFWVWRVDPQSQGAGWSPHRDKGFESLLADGSPKSLTVWIALTDANPLNGCMYIVPAHLDPPSKYDGREDEWIPEDMQDIRALPVTAGSALAWNQAILHWGGRASQRASEPRISFACEFQRADVAPYNEPLLGPTEAPPFEQRLRLIGKQILQYRHMYEFSEKLSSVGEQLAN